MRRVLALFLASSFAVPLPARQSGSQSTTIQMQCHDLAKTGNYVAPDEMVINGQACKQVSVNTLPTSPAADAPPAQPATPGQADAPAPQPPAAAADAPAPRGFLLEDATPVHLVFSQTVSSATAQTGDTIELEVVDDVTVDGLLIIPHGSTAWATVTDAEHKRHLGRPGKLDINIDKVRLADGEKTLLRAVKDVQGGSHTGAMTGAMVATSLVLLPAAPLFLFMHGKDITIPKGTAITAFTQGDVRLDANKFQKQLAVTN
jgi:hypothetical protein